MNLTKEQAIEQIHGRVLVVFNDSNEVFIKCAKILWPNLQFDGGYFFYQQGQIKEKVNCLNSTNLPTIPATELLRILEGEWMPEVGKEYEFSDNNTFFHRAKLIAIIEHEYKYIIEVAECPFSRKFCRPIQKKQTTIAELLKETGRNENEWEVVK